MCSLHSAAAVEISIDFLRYVTRTVVINFHLQTPGNLIVFCLAQVRLASFSAWDSAQDLHDRVADNKDSLCRTSLRTPIGQNHFSNIVGMNICSSQQSVDVRVQRLASSMVSSDLHVHFFTDLLSSSTQSNEAAQ